MIKIDRDNYPPSHKYLIGPDKGQERWRVAERNVFSDYKANATQFNSGTGGYTFAKHPSYAEWKNELKRVQGNKCCYCEKAISTGELEHYRPKSAWQNSKGSPMNSPGYYWLAYRWSNLLLSCGDCNESGRKGNVFPIFGTRAVTPKCILSSEIEQYINPYNEDPSESISFRKDTPYHLNLRGKRMIEDLELRDRADLIESRKDKYQRYYLTQLVFNSTDSLEALDAEDKWEGERLFKSVQRKKEAFSGMILENLKSGRF